MLLPQLWGCSVSHTHNPNQSVKTFINSESPFSNHSPLPIHTWCCVSVRGSLWTAKTGPVGCGTCAWVGVAKVNTTNVSNACAVPQSNWWFQIVYCVFKWQERALAPSPYLCFVTHNGSLCQGAVQLWLPEKKTDQNYRISLPDFLPGLWLYIVASGIEFARFPTANKKEYTLYIHLAI